MTTFIVATTTIIAIIGIGVAGWSIFDTRKKYFEDYVKRKKQND